MREPVIPQFEMDEFLRWEETQERKFELHHGFTFAFDGGTLDHDQISFNLRTLLDRTFPAPCRTFGSDVKVRVSEASLFYCDAGVICDETDGDATVIDRPRIVAEVLSRSTRAYDIVEKRAAYRAMASVEAYLIVHTDMRRIEIDARGTSGSWSTDTYDDEPALLAGRALALDDVYARTSLEETANG